MTRDRRFWRANGRVAHVDCAEAAGLPAVSPTPRRILEPFTDLCRSPGEGRDKQLLFGALFDVLEVHDGVAFGYDPADGYVGYVSETALGAPQEATHRVRARGAHVYSAPDFKSPERTLLPMGACVRVESAQGAFLGLAEGGWIAEPHLSPDDTPVSDWVDVAESLLGTPYLWGGNTSFGIDCSGLVVLAMRAAGRTVPRDSDLQEVAFPAVPSSLQRGDLVFWRGHVGIMRDAETLLHANAHHMTVASEPLATAIDRIAQKEFGEVTKVARP